MWMNARQMIAEIVEGLFSHEVLRHQKAATVILQRNPNGWGKVLYADRVFIPNGGNPGMNRVTLDPSLYDDMDKLILDIETMEEDRKVISQVLFVLLSGCDTRQDIADALPAIVVSCVPFLEPVASTRVKDEAHCIQGDERALKQYEKIRDKMELYARLQKQPNLSRLIGYYNYEV